jgi:DNA repair exonuclease SbcCD ATPase subunit
VILKSLEVNSFGGLNPGAHVGAFSDKITVFHGPNQTGKSTLFRALVYGLYQRHTVSGAQVEREIMPVGTSLAPKVTIVFEMKGTTYRVTKQFLKRPTSKLEEARGSGFVPLADGTEADERLRELLGSAFAGKGLTKVEQRGMGEVLMVDQGKLRFGETLGERVREDLRDLIGTVGTPEAGHGLIQRVKARYEEIFTPTGDYKKGQSAPAVVTLQNQLTQLESDLQLLAQDLHLAQKIEQRLAHAISVSQLQKEQDQFEKDLEQARAKQLAHLELTSDLQRLEDQASARRKSAEECATTCSRVARARAERESLSRWLDQLRTEEQRLKRGRADSDAEIREAETALHALDPERAHLEKHREAWEEAKRAVALAEQLQSLRKGVLRFEELGRETDQLRSRLEEKLSLPGFGGQRVYATADSDSATLSNSTGLK